MKPHVILTHPQRRELRRQMAEAVKSGRSADLVAHECARTVRAVQMACREFGVPCPRKATVRLGQPGPSTVAIVADLLVGGQTQVDIAARRGVTHQRVGQISAQVRAAGYKTRGRRMKENDHD